MQSFSQSSRVSFAGAEWFRLVGMSSRVGAALRACGVVPHMWKELGTEDEAIASLA